MVNDNRDADVCRVCGLDQQERIWGDNDHSPTFEICDCCGAEFGYHDFTLEGIKAHRERWLTNDGKWWGPKAKPPNWSLEEQMKHIPAKYN
jgi:uncharacterized protein YfaT (DUF1175 family)